MSEIIRCNMCNKDLSSENFWAIKYEYICEKCYDLYYAPKYNGIKRNELIKHDNQKAIECLKEVKEHISKGLEYDYDVQIWFEEYIDNKIKELEEESD